MKYTLKKKWHPSQVEEVGHVFKENKYFNVDYQLPDDTYFNIAFSLNPHEIALLCEAGYLEKQEEIAERVNLDEERRKRDTIRHLSIDSRNIDTYPDPQLELWTTEPPKRQVYFYITDTGKLDDDVYNKFEDRHIFRLRTKNCHRTQKSAEEALKRLLA